MFDQIRIEALNASCASCGVALKDRDRITSAYSVKDIRSFEFQVELGILGADIRNYWIHVDCIDPALSTGLDHLQPSIHPCIRCNEQLESQDVICPVFQVVTAKVQNPSDPTDIGIGLGERVYFVHADCKNKELTKQPTSILYTP